MKYVFDTSGFVGLFNNYYRSRFPSLWKQFDQMILDGRVISTREVKREIGDQDDNLKVWADEHSHIFLTPTANEGRVVADIYSNEHFQANIEQRKLLKGGKNADPFVIALARVEGAIVVTLEKNKPNAAKIPNICDDFLVGCVDLEGFMEEESWVF